MSHRRRIESTPTLVFMIISGPATVFAFYIFISFSSSSRLFIGRMQLFRCSGSISRRRRLPPKRRPIFSISSDLKSAPEASFYSRSSSAPNKTRGRSLKARVSFEFIHHARAVHSSSASNQLNGAGQSKRRITQRDRAQPQVVAFSVIACSLGIRTPR